MVDEPPDFETMAAIVEETEQNLRDRPMPGGTALGEKLGAEARMRAGLVDLPGDVERMSAAMRARRKAEERNQSLGGYRPSYPWQAS